MQDIRKIIKKLLSEMHCSINCSTIDLNEEHMILVCVECKRVYSDFCMIKQMYEVSETNSMWKSMPDDRYENYLERVDQYLADRRG